MNLTRRPDLESKLLDDMRASFGREERPEGEIHVSDLMTPRQAYWSRVLPRPISDEQIGYFVAGRGHEDAVGRISGCVKGEPEAIDGIWLRPDFYLDEPLEFKTRRRKLAQEPVEAEDKYAWYLRQLRSYCALKRVGEGHLWVLGLAEREGDTGKTKPEFQVWTVAFTDAELELERQGLARQRTLLATAWATRDPSPLPLCPAWQCGERIGRMVTPPVCQTCKQTFETEWGAGRHQASKKGAGHVVTPPDLEWTYTPKCRWWDVCEPWRVDADRGPRTVPDPEPAIPF